MQIRFHSALVPDLGFETLVPVAASLKVGRRVVRPMGLCEFPSM